MYCEHSRHDLKKNIYFEGRTGSGEDKKNVQKRVMAVHQITLFSGYIKIFLTNWGLKLRLIFFLVSNFHSTKLFSFKRIELFSLKKPPLTKNLR